MGFLLAIRFETDMIGYVAGEDGTILKTSDGGIAWVSVGGN
jgi:photosystem II stability/assembly factor-like uncharacterized protein